MISNYRLIAAKLQICFLLLKQPIISLSCILRHLIEVTGIIIRVYIRSLPTGVLGINYGLSLSGRILEHYFFPEKELNTLFLL